MALRATLDLLAFISTLAEFLITAHNFGLTSSVEWVQASGRAKLSFYMQNSVFFSPRFFQAKCELKLFSFPFLLHTLVARRVFCCSCSAAPVRTSVRRAGDTSGPSSTSCSAGTPAPASPSCCSTCTTWCRAASTRQARAPAPWVSPHTWWRTRRPGSWCCRPEPWCSATTASAASTSSTRWATARARCCTRSWSSRRSPLPRWHTHTESSATFLFAFLKAKAGLNDRSCFSGRDHLPAERPHRCVGRCQPCRVSVEPQKDHHREHPAAPHAAVQVREGWGAKQSKAEMICEPFG